MAIVRFDDEGSDVYVYREKAGYRVFVARRCACQEILDDTLIPSRLFDTWDECRQFLKKLRDDGCTIPDFVFDFEE